MLVLSSFCWIIGLSVIHGFRGSIEFHIQGAVVNSFPHALKPIRFSQDSWSVTRWTGCHVNLLIPSHFCESGLIINKAACNYKILLPLSYILADGNQVSQYEWMPLMDQTPAWATCSKTDFWKVIYIYYHFWNDFILQGWIKKITVSNFLLIKESWKIYFFLNIDWIIEKAYSSKIKIIILERFLKDHVSLRTGVMMLKMSPRK